MAAKDCARPCGHHRPRGTEGTQSQPCLMRAEHGNPVGVRHAVKGGGKPEVTMDQFHWRDRMPKKRTPAAERRQETEMRSISPPLVVSHNWPDTGRGTVRARKRAHMGR